LIWIRGALSPQDIRDRLLDEPEFEGKLIRWLEDCHVGDFLTAKGHELAQGLEEEYLQHLPDGKTRLSTRLKQSVRDPATTLPAPPSCEHADAEWFSRLARETDEIVFCSNRHDPSHGKGCWRGDPGYCRARFPREVFEETQVDRASGALRFAKHEPWLNTYNPVLSYVLRCNTDVTSLLSGTQVKAVVAYVCDYVTKSSVSTHTFFEVVRSV
ncbi:hypothetical protein OH77DRAFT_1361593, partial [Trametes cingulata]